MRFANKSDIGRGGVIVRQQARPATKAKRSFFLLVNA
jgi:hypothetical protein